MRPVLFICLLYCKFCFTKVSFKERNLIKRETDVSYGSPAYKYCECGRPNAAVSDKFRVIGGEEVAENQFPWIAALITIKDLQLRCGGTIINDRYIVTAAHCLISNYKMDDIKVIVGKHNLCTSDSRSVIFSIEKLIIHPHYNDTTNSADIMLVKLVMRISFNKYVRPICLPKIGPNVAAEFAEYSVTLLGWGYADTPGKVCSLRTTNLTIYKPDNCPKKDPTMFCAGYMNASRGSCQGDSGGPLQLLNKDGKLELIGIVSTGIGCGDVTYPDFYTNVPRMIPWIMAVTTRDSMFCWR